MIAAIHCRRVRMSDAATAQPPRASRRLRDLPAPPGEWPVLGHLTRVKPLVAHRQLEDWGRALGMPYRLQLGPTPVVVLDDVELYHRVVRERPQRWIRNGRILPVSREMGLDGLFSVEGDEWEVQRRLIMQSLNASHFRGFFPTLRAVTQRLHRRWYRAAKRGETLEMGDELMRYTVDVTSALAFGEDPNTIERDGDRIQQHLAAIFPMLMKRVLLPWPVWHWLKLPADRRLERDLAAVHAYVGEVIERARTRRRDEPRAPGEPPRHVLEAMLDACDAPGSEFTQAMVHANVLTLLLAGEDTTAHSLAWTLPFIAADPARQARLNGEAVAALGDAAVAPSLDVVRELDAFEALATEATRLRPVVAFLILDAIGDERLGDLAVPAGTRLIFLMRPQATNPAHFADPRDFRPERWAVPAARGDRAHEPRAHNQFGAGPRVCPGRHLAAVEMRLVLSMLLRHFEIELACDPSDIDEVCAFTVMPSRMPVRLRLRDNATAPN
jgi:cytochrome P450